MRYLCVSNHESLRRQNILQVRGQPKDEGRYRSKNQTITKTLNDNYCGRNYREVKISISNYLDM